MRWLLRGRSCSFWLAGLDWSRTSSLSLANFHGAQKTPTSLQCGGHDIIAIKCLAVEVAAVAVTPQRYSLLEGEEPARLLLSVCIEFASELS